MHRPIFEERKKKVPQVLKARRSPLSTGRPRLPICRVFSFDKKKSSLSLQGFATSQKEAGRVLVSGRTLNWRRWHSPPLFRVRALTSDQNPTGKIEGADGVQDVADMVDVDGGADVTDAQAAEDVADAEDREDVDDAKATDNVADAEDVEDAADVSHVQYGADVADVQDVEDVEDVDDVRDVADVEDVHHVNDAHDVDHADYAQSANDADDVAEVTEVADVEEVPGAFDVASVDSVADVQDVDNEDVVPLSSVSNVGVDCQTHSRAGLWHILRCG